MKGSNRRPYGALCKFSQLTVVIIPSITLSNILWQLEGPLTQSELHEIIQEYGAIRTGATVDVDRRRDEYEEDGYSGTMFFAETRNMKFAEDRLLEIRVPRYNEQTLSNAQEEEGYVYVIQGRRQR